MEKTLKALSDVTRLKIVFLLSFGELCICDIFNILNIPQATASRHMQYMLKHGLVCVRKSGKWRYYSLDLSGNTFTSRLVTFVAHSLYEDGKYAQLLELRQSRICNRFCTKRKFYE